MSGGYVQRTLPDLTTKFGDGMNENARNGWGTLEEAAEAMGVSTKTIRRRIADGSIRAVKFGPRLIRVDMQSLEQPGTLLAMVGTAAA